MTHAQLPSHRLQYPFLPPILKNTGLLCRLLMKTSLLCRRLTQMNLHDRHALGEDLNGSLIDALDV